MTATRQKIKQPPKRRIKMSTEDKIYNIIGLIVFTMYAVMNVIMCFSNGIGEIKYPTTVNLFILWGVRIPVAYLLSQIGYGGYAMASVPLSFLSGMILMLFYFRTKRWAELRALAKNEP